MKASRNEAYYKLLQQGLLIYLKAQASILETSVIPQYDNEEVKRNTTSK
jgi:hypothetical protein